MIRFQAQLHFLIDLPSGLLGEFISGVHPAVDRMGVVQNPAEAKGYLGSLGDRPGIPFVLEDLDGRRGHNGARVGPLGL